MATVLAPCDREVQRLSALRVANDVRIRNKEFKQAVKAWPTGTACELVAEVFEGCHPAYDGMLVMQLLRSIPKMGMVKAERLLRVHRVPTNVKVRAVNPHSRRAIAVRLRDPQKLFPSAHVS